MPLCQALPERRPGAAERTQAVVRGGPGVRELQALREVPAELVRQMAPVEPAVRQAHQETVA